MKQHLIKQATEYVKIYSKSSKESLIYTMINMYKLTKEEAELVYNSVVK